MDAYKLKSKQAFNSQAATYDEDIKGQHARSLYPILLDKLNGLQYESVLDLGCGTGAVLKLITDRHPDVRAYGIDISENMLAQAEKKLNDRVTLKLGDAEHLPFDAAEFDVVCCNDSFHHYPSPACVLSEINRVLKPGGTVFICDTWQPFLSRIIMNIFMKYSNEGDVKMYSEAEICNLMAKHFKDIVWKRVNHTSFMASGTK